ncbi:3'(2'),5'-bisphosphate nucleotidase CysQ [Labilibacter marinus]|uniref:3'(2'),5'-bisphosphate nucleotidase CysQ n=1 Tax=Labilibacter marinus TaxID=1477105 RepID=UPI00094F624F|nr:3'(2'),5'-bisphosphate nucleotidase CysQ [Labilibacter marinus]
MNDLLKIAIDAAVDAGKAIMDIYRTGDFGVEKKADNSPLTLADKAAHEIIEQYLVKTKIPVLSEEGAHEDYEKRKQWNQLWIVDPLDGTKEFVKKTGEFTVNIALIEDNYPITGVVFVPATRTLYYASKEYGAFKAILQDDWEEHTSVEIKNEQKLPAGKKNKSLKIVASVSHLSKETEQFAEMLKGKYGESEFLSVGSSIKICKVAEGTADIYPRLGPTMEWDTAAGQAVAEAAGAQFINWETKERFDYNRPELLNKWFVVAGNKIEEDELVQLINDFKA